MFKVSALLVLCFALTSSLAAARSRPCACYHGTVIAEQPQCSCQCEGDYIGPWCQYSGLDNVTVQVWYNFPPAEFVSSRQLEHISSGLGGITTISFLYAVPGNFAKTMGVYRLQGADAYNLKVHVDRGSNWIGVARIISVYEATMRVEEAPQSKAALVELYRSGEVVITAEGVAYGASAVIAALLLLFVEYVSCCHGGNNESDIARDVAKGEWDIRLGYANRMTYVHEPPPAQHVDPMDTPHSGR
jgi:hypothetical protein